MQPPCGINQQINLFLSRLNEPQRRWYVGVISEAADSPSDRQLALITGRDEKTIQRGRHELVANLADAPAEKQRHAVGGWPRAEKDPALEATLLALVEPHTVGDPMTDAKWLNCHLDDLQEQLDAYGHAVSRPVISRLLKAHDYRLHASAKELSGLAQPKRNAQFEHIIAQRTQHLVAAQQVGISVDTNSNDTTFIRSGTIRSAHGQTLTRTDPGSNTFQALRVV